MDWVPWRGSRSVRDWPEQFCEGVTWPWQAIQYRGNAPLPTETLTHEQALAAGLIPDQPSWDDQQIDHGITPERS